MVWEGVKLDLVQLVQHLNADLAISNKVHKDRISKQRDIQTHRGIKLCLRCSTF